MMQNEWKPNTKALAAMMCSCASLLCCMQWMISLLLAVIGLVLGILGPQSGRRRDCRNRCRSCRHDSSYCRGSSLYYFIKKHFGTRSGGGVNARPLSALCLRGGRITWTIIIWKWEIINLYRNHLRDIAVWR